jgi:ATP-dependent DNA ligase
MLTRVTPPPGFIEPCLPSPAEHPPVGPNWVHEIKHDGFRLMARRDPAGIRLLTRNGNNWSERYPLIFEAMNHLRVRSCLIDGEAVCCDDDGLAVFERLRRKREGGRVFLCAFDLLFASPAPPWLAVQSASHPSRRRRVPTRLQDGPGRHSVEAAGLALRLRSLEGLAQVQEPERAGGEARGGRGLGLTRRP